MRATIPVSTLDTDSARRQRHSLLCLWSIAWPGRTRESRTGRFLPARRTTKRIRGFPARALRAQVRRPRSRTRMCHRLDRSAKRTRTGSCRRSDVIRALRTVRRIPRSPDPPRSPSASHQASTHISPPPADGTHRCSSSLPSLDSRFPSIVLASACPRSGVKPPELEVIPQVPGISHLMRKICVAHFPHIDGACPGRRWFQLGSRRVWVQKPADADASPGQRADGFDGVSRRRGASREGIRPGGAVTARKTSSAMY
ncbi:hypothetical protein BH10ACT5_BH10ACT5_07920 [soil metagenome]